MLIWINVYEKTKSISFKRAHYVGGYAGEIRGVCHWGTTKCEITLQDKSTTLPEVTFKEFRRSDVWFSGVNGTYLYHWSWFWMIRRRWSLGSG